MDPRRELVLLWDRTANTFQDKTAEIERYTFTSVGKIAVTFSRGREYTYNSENVRVGRYLAQIPVPHGCRVEIHQKMHEDVVEIQRFVTDGDEYDRVFFRRPSSGRQDHQLYPASAVRVLHGLIEGTRSASVLRYWRSILAQMDSDDALQYPFRRLRFVHPDSVLATYLAGSSIRIREPPFPPIFPFNCNLSQRRAVEQALIHSVSVIEGPPGTGKTETILNIIASIVSSGGGSIAVVASTNAAIQNVHDKLLELGLEHMVAWLGKTANREKFFESQDARRTRVADFSNRACTTWPDSEIMASCDQALQRAQEVERRRAVLDQDLKAYRLERDHFLRHIADDDDNAPQLDEFPLFRKSSDRVLEYLAETEVDFLGRSPGIIRRIRRYFRYGSLRGLDAGQSSVVLAIQRKYYDLRIAEIEIEIASIREQLTQTQFSQLAEQYRNLSLQTLEAALVERYGSMDERTYGPVDLKTRVDFEDLIRDYPVVLSTCHSIRECAPSDYLFDYVVIDEASQVDLLTAGIALSICRNAVIVGDIRQLPPIASEAAADLVPPAPAFDYRSHSIISSLVVLYGERLPRTLLREHYRCDPAIIGFCNKAFYDGELVAFTQSSEDRPMLVVRTTEGNHMRQHREGGRSNQREIDVITKNILPRFCSGVRPSDIGITTPYRRQADKAVASLLDDIESDTIHKFQGRQKDVVVLTTVLDDTWRGRSGMAFTDDPHKVNVAVSRAKRRFILVTNHSMLPTSKTLRSLIGYIRYLSPDHLIDSDVVSVFDLLYRDYNARLLPLAARLTGEMGYRSEDIIWELLRIVLGEPENADLAVRFQVLLRSLVPRIDALDAAQRGYVKHRASVDFVIYSRVTNDPVLAIEVDGFAFHENSPTQLRRDGLKDGILELVELPLLRLATTGSDEKDQLRQALLRARQVWARKPTAQTSEARPQAPKPEPGQ